MPTDTREDHLRDALDWWRSEWEHKNREAEWLWRGLFFMAFFSGLCFFIGTVVG